MRKRNFFMLGKDQAKERVKAWLTATFKFETEKALARAWVFREYQQFCLDEGIESTSQSAFGRILKDVFPALEHRRLGPRNNNKMHYQHLALRTPVAAADLRTSSSGPATPASPPSAAPSGSIASSPLRAGSATPVLQTADDVPYHHTRTSELEQTPSFDDEWDYTMSALSDVSPGQTAVDFHLPHTSHSAYGPPAVLSDMVCHPSHQAVPRFDVQGHPWVRLPFLASAQLLDFPVDAQAPHLRDLALFVDRFLRFGDSVHFDSVSVGLIEMFQQNSTDASLHYALFVVAWWTRLLARDDWEGRQRAIGILKLLLSSYGGYDSQLAIPAVEFLRSCESIYSHEQSNMMSFHNALGLREVLDQWKRDGDVDEGVREMNRAKLTVGKILFHATQALSLANALERAHSAELLRQEMMGASAPLLAVSLHELECRGMLEMAVHVLHDLRERPPIAHRSFLPGLLERMAPFVGIHSRLAQAIYRAENQKPVLHQFGSTLPVPEFQEIPPDLHSPVQEVRTKLERYDIGEGSAPSSPFCISESTLLSAQSRRHLLPQPPQFQHYAYGEPPQQHHAYCPPPMPSGYPHGPPYQVSASLAYGPLPTTFAEYSSLLPTPPETLR